MIEYKIENNLKAEEFIAVLEASSLAERRPVNDVARITGMLKHANLIVTARDMGQLIGIARSITDFAYCTYLSDLAVDRRYQRRGIGKELIRETKLASPLAKLILLSAPAAIDYYPHIGMKHHPYCYFIDDVADII